MDPETIEVQRVKPPRRNLAVLRFLTENRDFLRARLDRLRQVARDTKTEAEEIDPRYFTYQDMLRALISARFTAEAERDQWEERELMTRVSELAALEEELDAIELLLIDQVDRMVALETDFIGREETRLIVLVRGQPSGIEIGTIRIADEEAAVSTAELGSDERRSLEQGGIAEIGNEYVEPREQLLEISLADGQGSALAPAYLTYTPVRGHLNFLELDLAGVTAEDGAAGVRAHRWVYDAIAGVREARGVP